ncbi:hypothetical protein Tco_0042498, partial [Tanacetum coccineum]
MGTESRPLEDLREIEIPQSLLVVPSPVPSSADLYLTVGQAHTPATVDTESEPEEAPSEIEEFLPLVSKIPLTNEKFEASKPSDTRTASSYSLTSSDSTTPLSPDHPLTQASPTPTPTRALFHHRTARIAVLTQPTLSPGMSARIAKATALSPSSFFKRYRSSYETPSPSSSPTLPIQKRYRGTPELIEDTEDESSDLNAKREGSKDEGHGLEDEGPGLEEEEEAAPEGQQHTVPTVDTVMDEPLRLGYGALRRRELALGEGSVPSTFKIGQNSRSVLEQQRVGETPAPRIPMHTTWIDPQDNIVYLDIEIDPRACAPVQTLASP